MKKILFIIAILLPSLAFADQFQDSIRVDGKKVPAEFVTTGDNTCALGSGRNACISQYVLNNVVIPNEVKYNNKTYKVQKVNAFAFRFCTGITSVRVLEGVTSIGNFAFAGCSSLEDVTLPSTLQTIGSGAFAGLPKLKRVTCNATTPPTWEYNDVFHFYEGGIGSTDESQYDMTLYVPDGKISDYQDSKFDNTAIGWNTKVGWGNFNSIQENSTFHITSAKDLETLRDDIKSHNWYHTVELDDDIDMNGEVWTETIGDSQIYPFMSTFNGNGHTISNLTVNTTDAGLFGHVQGAKIKNLVLKNCKFTGTANAGALCAYIDPLSKCSIDSVFAENNVVEGMISCGGLVGYNTGNSLTISECVVKGGTVKVTEENKHVGGFIGYSLTNTSCEVSNCALLETTIDRTNNCYYGPFIAGADPGSKDKTKASYCFATCDLGNSDSQVTHENCIYKGLQYGYKDDMGLNHNITFGPDHNSFKKQAILTVGTLKLDKWVYCPGEYPLPACFEDRLPEPKVNVMTLRPATMPYGRINGLSLRNADDFATANWNDFSGKDNSCAKLDFETSRLWVDGKLGGSLAEGMMPIRSMSILSILGVQYDRVLTADKTGYTEEYGIPIFETNDDGTVKLDDDGQPIIDGYETFEEDKYNSIAYPIVLPYETTMPHNCQVFKPARLLSDAGGVATIELQMVENRKMEAYTPYFVVVNVDYVELGTTFETTLKPQVNKIEFDGYEFNGSPYFLDKDAAYGNKVYSVDEDDDFKWTVMTDDNQQDVQAFQAYFQSKGTKTSEIRLTLERVEDDNFEYEMVFDDDDNRLLYATKYKGEGGDVVVPNTVTANVSGTKHTMSVIGIVDNVFEEKAEKIRSVDLTKCEDIDVLYVDRNMQGNPFYGLKDNALVFVPEEKAFPSVNVVVGDKCQKLLLKEGETFYSPHAFKAVHVEYKRTMDADDCYTICLPYSAPKKDGLKYYALSGVDGTTLQFDEVTETQPGVPYLVVTTSAVENLDFDGDAETSTDVTKTVVDGGSAGGYTMHGTFSTILPAQTVGKYILQAGKKWQKAKTTNPTVYIDPFRAYLTGSANARELLESAIGEGTTAIQNIQTIDKDGTEQWYDLNGRRIDGKSAKKGVYIQKDKKVMSH